jgi:hypothetical protein
VVAHTKAAVELAACSRSRDEAAACSEDGSGITMVSRVIEERERAQGQKLLSVVRESMRPEILVHGT